MKDLDANLPKKFVCSDLNKRGKIGENLLHLCFFNCSSQHMKLAKRLLLFYPKLINDFYTSDEFYGTCLLLL